MKYKNSEIRFSFYFRFPGSWVLTEMEKVLVDDNFTELVHCIPEISRLHKPYSNLFLLFFVSNIWTFILTVLPVFASIGPTTYYSGHPGWYTGNDVVRFIEPFGGFIFNFYLFERSGIFARTRSVSDSLVVFIFLFGCALFGQGAGFHSASNMFKHSTEGIMHFHDDVAVRDEYYWIRTVWEHEVSHYIYAVGYAIVAACQAWVYRDHKFERLPDCTWYGGFSPLLILAAIVYGALLTGIAAEFPSGVVVMICYLGLYGFCGIGGYLLHEYYFLGRQFAFGERPVLHYFLLSYVLSFTFLMAYIGLVGGLHTRSQAGL